MHRNFAHIAKEFAEGQAHRNFVHIANVMMPPGMQVWYRGAGCNGDKCDENAAG